MSKINEWLLDREQQGLHAFQDTPSHCNDAHGDDFQTMKETGFIFDNDTDLKAMFGSRS